jgi:hypothetical protein
MSAGARVDAMNDCTSLPRSSSSSASLTGNVGAATLRTLDTLALLDAVRTALCDDGGAAKLIDNACDICCDVGTGGSGVL